MLIQESALFRGGFFRKSKAEKCYNWQNFFLNKHPHHLTVARIANTFLGSASYLQSSNVSSSLLEGISLNVIVKFQVWVSGIISAELSVPLWQLYHHVELRSVSHSKPPPGLVDSLNNVSHSLYCIMLLYRNTSRSQYINKFAAQFQH